MYWDVLRLMTNNYYTYLCNAKKLSFFAFHMFTWFQFHVISSWLAEATLFSTHFEWLVCQPKKGLLKTCPGPQTFTDGARSNLPSGLSEFSRPTVQPRNNRATYFKVAGCLACKPNSTATKSLRPEQKRRPFQSKAGNAWQSPKQWSFVICA